MSLNIKKKLALAAAVGTAVLLGAPAHAGLQSFVIDPGYYDYPPDADYGGSSIGFNGITHGTVVSSDTGEAKTFFHDLIPGHLDVDISWGSGDSWGGAHNHAPETAHNGFTVAFDSHLHGTEDPDLEDPFKNPSTGQWWTVDEDKDLRRPGHIFFVQENNDPHGNFSGGQSTKAGCLDDGVCNDDFVANNSVGVDDDADGQWTWIDFSMEVTIEEMALFDIDGCDHCSGNEWAYVGLYEEIEESEFDDSSDQFKYKLEGGDFRYYQRIFEKNIGHIGNHAATRVTFDDGVGGAGVSNVDAMLVDFSSSGAFDQIKGHKDIPDPPQTDVPEPLTGSLVLLGLAGVGVARARKRNAAKA